MHGIDGLVLLGVTLILRDVGRQGHMSCLVHGLVERKPLCRRKAHEPAAARIVHVVDDLARKDDRSRLRCMGATGTILDDIARLQALARVHEALPDMSQRILVLAALQEQCLGDAACLALPADETCRHDTGLVCDEQVSRLEVLADIGERAVLVATVLAVQHEEAAGIPRVCRLLRDELIRQRIVEIVSAHRDNPF